MKGVVMILTFVNLTLCFLAWFQGRYSYEIGISTTVAIVAVVWYFLTIKK